MLWPIPVIGFVLYPYTKRFTWLCHLFLGLVDGLAPLGGWIAVTDHLGLDPFLLGGAVALWIGGFDVIYATMDLDIDRAQGLNSLPLRFGIGPALLVTRVGAPDLGGAAGVARPEPGARARSTTWAWRWSRGCSPTRTRSSSADDLSRVDIAFLTLNGVISVVFLAGVLLDAVV